MFAKPPKDQHNNGEYLPTTKETTDSGQMVDGGQVLTRPDLLVRVDSRDIAIESLRHKIAAKQPPNPLMPLGSLATAFHLLTNTVDKIMINNLGAGHVPIYAKNGEVIGTRHAISGELTAGREPPRSNNRIWNNQG